VIDYTFTLSATKTGSPAGCAKKRRRLLLGTAAGLTGLGSSVSRILFPLTANRRGVATISLGRALPSGSSDLPAEGPDLVGPGGVPGRDSSAYLVLLPVGFTVPGVSPRPRCALTAPFHPYLAVASCWLLVASKRQPAASNCQAVYFLWHFPSDSPAIARRVLRLDVIKHRCPVQFGLSSRALRRARSPRRPQLQRIIRGFGVLGGGMQNAECRMQNESGEGYRTFGHFGGWVGGGGGDVYTWRTRRRRIVG